MVIQAIFGVIALLDLLISSALGWRYVFSRAFRSRMNARWHARGHVAAAVEMTGYAVFFLVGNALFLLFLLYIYRAGVWLYDAIVAPRLGHVG